MGNDTANSLFVSHSYGIYALYNARAQYAAFPQHFVSFLFPFQIRSTSAIYGTHTNKFETNFQKLVKTSSTRARIWSNYYQFPLLLFSILSILSWKFIPFFSWNMRLECILGLTGLNCKSVIFEQSIRQSIDKFKTICNRCWWKQQYDQNIHRSAESSNRSIVFLRIGELQSSHGQVILYYCDLNKISQPTTIGF